MVTGVGFRQISFTPIFVHELRVITVPIDYHWKCVRVYCACAESCDSRVGDQKELHFWNPRPRFVYLLCNFGGSTMKIIKVICENNARPALKTYGFLRMRQIMWSVKDAVNVFFAVVLVDVDLPYWTSKVEHMIAFTVIFSNMCTAHAHVQKRLFMFFRCKFRQRRSIPRPRFPVRVQNFGKLATFSVDFCVLYAVCLPDFYFRFVSHTGLESISHASTPTSIIPTKVEVYMTVHCRKSGWVKDKDRTAFSLWISRNSRKTKQ